jgi:hypothetical protein
MATVSTISIDSASLNLFDHPTLDPEALQKASEVLQENHDIHHIFFSPFGLHVSPDKLPFFNFICIDG